MIMRGEQLKIMGEKAFVEKSVEIMNSLIELAKRGTDIIISESERLSQAESLLSEKIEEEIKKISIDYTKNIINGKI